MLTLPRQLNCHAPTARGGCKLQGSRSLGGGGREGLRRATKRTCFSCTLSSIRDGRQRGARKELDDRKGIAEEWWRRRSSAAIRVAYVRGVGLGGGKSGRMFGGAVQGNFSSMCMVEFVVLISDHPPLCLSAYCVFGFRPLLRDCPACQACAHVPLHVAHM